MVEKCRYIEITISTKNSDLYLLLRKFSNCFVSAKCHLFKIYCSTLYCAPMWFDCIKTALKKLKLACNNSLRRFMRLPWRNSASEMFVNLNIYLFDEMLEYLRFGFMHTLISMSIGFILFLYNLFLCDVDNIYIFILLIVFTQSFLIFFVILYGP